MREIFSPLARMGLFYYSAMKSLIAKIKEKDLHINALHEKLSDLGGSYYPRKHKDSLGSFDVEKWREEQRNRASEGAECGWEVFGRWSEFEEDELKDWEAVVTGLGQWSRDNNEDREKVLNHDLHHS
jgi:hypothetical protein